MEDPGEPRYLAIKQWVLNGVASGALRPGDRVPSESELVERFAVSRMTANRALRELGDAGVVTRRPGVGSFVAEPRPIGQMIEVRNIADEIRARGHEYRATVLLNARVKATRGTAPLLGVATATPLFHSVIVHHEAGSPVQHEERWVLAEVAPGYADQDFTVTTPNAYLTRVAPLERAEHRVRAAMPDPAIASALALRPGEPVLVMTRLSWTRGRLASHAVLTHPASRFELSAAVEVAGR